MIVCFPSPHWLMELLLSNILFVTIFHGLVFESKTLKEQLKEEKFVVVLKLKHKDSGVGVCLRRDSSIRVVVTV